MFFTPRVGVAGDGCGAGDGHGAARAGAASHRRLGGASLHGRQCVGWGGEGLLDWTVGRRQRLFNNNNKKKGGGLLDSVTDRGVTICTARTETLVPGTRTELTARPCSLHYVYTKTSCASSIGQPRKHHPTGLPTSQEPPFSS